MHQFALNKLKEYNIPTSNRSSYKNFMWNGANLALTNHKLINNKLIPYELTTLEILQMPEKLRSGIFTIIFRGTTAQAS